MDDLLEIAIQMVRLGVSLDDVFYALQQHGAADPRPLIAEAVEWMSIEDQANSVLEAVRRKP